MMEIALSVGLGLGLAAAAGFRIFVPLLVMSVAARAEWLTLGESFEWIASSPALIAFAAATALEVGAYYIPWLDNLLDTVATPAAIVAGVIVTASVVTGMSPFLRWGLAVIAGGGVAGAVQAATVGTRSVSSVMTAGFGNPLVSTIEGGSGLLLSLAAIIAPLVALVAVVLLLIFLRRWIARRRRLATA
jgi:hypothetical protein